MNYVSTNRMTKYEKARILGTRANQISMNASIMIDPKGEKDPLKIAEMELKQRKLPIIICRNYPNGLIEELSIENIIFDE